MAAWDSVRDIGRKGEEEREDEREEERVELEGGENGGRRREMWRV